jgi:hypothetical protein
MGISLAEAHVLFSLKRRDSLGDEFLSLGRPEVYISKRELQGLVSAYDLSWSENDISRATSAAYAEPLLQLLGFRTVRSLDISAYQGANIIHDLNWPIPKEFEATTNFLYGNGTIEHVFDIATALKNVVRLLRVGGMVVLAGPANGYCGPCDTAQFSINDMLGCGSRPEDEDREAIEFIKRYKVLGRENKPQDITQGGSRCSSYKKASPIEIS